MSEKICHVCGNSGVADGDDGFFYCSRCGSRFDDMIETGIDEAELFSGGLYSAHGHTQSQRRLARPTPNPTPIMGQVSFRAAMEDDHQDGVGPTGPTDFATSQKDETQLGYADYFSETRMRYVMGFQIMVQLQCKSLVEKFKVSPLIVGLAGPIWLRFLESTGVMTDDWADGVIHESESQIPGDVEEIKLTDRSKNEPHNMFGQRAVMLWRKALNSKIPLSYSLSISFLVCHVAREGILPTDILKWVEEGQLPYFAAFLDIEKQLGPPSRACPISSRRMFRPGQSVPLQKLESSAASIAHKIGLELPPVNFYVIAARYLRQLSLPVEKILPQACRVYEWSMPSELHLSVNEHRLPTRIGVMSILIVTIRILYELNGGKWESNLSSRNLPASLADENGQKNSPSGSHTKARVAEMDMSSHDSETHERQSFVEESEYDALGLLKILEENYNDLNDVYEHSQDMSSYLQYCKHVVFAGLGPSYEDYEEEKIIEDLENFYQNQKGVEQCNDQEMNSSECHGERPGCNSESTYRKRKIFRETSFDGSTSRDFGSSDGDYCSKCSMDRSSFPPSKNDQSTESYRDRAVRQLKSNMNDNRFSYIRPKKNVMKKDGYIRYARKKDGAYVYVAHADYYILLRSCAKVTQVDIRTLHIGVLNFERSLELLEKRIDYCLQQKLNNNLSL